MGFRAGASCMRSIARNRRPLGERPGQVSDAPEVAVVPVPFPRQERVERVVEVVAPLRVEAVPSFRPGA